MPPAPRFPRLLTALLAALAACEPAPPRPPRAAAADERPVRVELRVAEGPPATRRPAAPPDSALRDSTWPDRVIRFASTEAPPLTLWAGDTLHLAAPEPPEGTPDAIAHDLRWTASQPDVVGVAPDGLLTARRPGAARVVAWRRVGETVTPVTVLPAARGRLLVADGGPDGVRDGTPPPQATLTLRDDDGTEDTLRTTPDGRFRWLGHAPLDGAATVTVTPTGPDALRYHPTALVVPLAALARLDVVLMPRRWRIDAGSYAGTEVAIDAGSAIARLRDGSRFWRFARTTPGGVLTAPVGWPPGRLPVPVALDVRGTAGPVDSAAFWAAARQLERDWGSPLFAPAPATDARRDGWVGITVEIDPRAPAAGFTTTTADGEGDLGAADVAFRSRAIGRDPGIVTHELLHALGIGHTERQESVMRTGGSLLGRASPEDVAYGRLLYAVRAIHARVGARFGIPP